MFTTFYITIQLLIKVQFNEQCYMYVIYLVFVARPDLLYIILYKLFV